MKNTVIPRVGSRVVVKTHVNLWAGHLGTVVGVQFTSGYDSSLVNYVEVKLDGIANSVRLLLGEIDEAPVVQPPPEPKSPYAEELKRIENRISDLTGDIERLKEAKKRFQHLELAWRAGFESGSQAR